jgi:integrase
MFFLHTPKSSKPTPIVIKKVLTDGTYKASLGVKVLPANWERAKERAVITGLDRDTINEHKSINMLLGKIEQFVEARTVDARYTGKHLRCAEIAAKIADLTGKKKTEVEMPLAKTFYDQCRIIISDMKTGALTTPRGKKYSAGTIKNYNQSLNTIEEYNPVQTFEGVNMEFYHAFVKWCNDKDFSMNYIAQHIKNLIGLMKVGKKRGYHDNTAYLDDDFKVIQENTEDIALSPAELDKLFKQNIPNKVRDIARDWFVIDCHLGLRVSDIQLLDMKNIEKDRVTIASEKTDTKVVIPLRPEVRAILKKWGGLPPKMSDQEINRSIKEVCEVVGFTDTVLYFLTKGGTRKDYYLKKYEMVSCHTARRSFITNLLSAGIPDNQVMQLAGIKKHATLLRYKKTTAEQNADSLKDHEYFK